VVVLSVEQPGHPVDRAPADGSTGGSWPSKNNRQAAHESLNGGDSDLTSADLPDATGLRPLSVSEGVSLRDECVVIETENGVRVGVDGLEKEDRPEGDRRARSWYSAVNQWRDWMDSPIYQSGHITFENGEGETVRTTVENSYMESYSSRYYARLKDLERGVKRRFDDVTTVMLTLSASSENAEGGRRCPADHMREIADGWDTARKQLPHILEGYNYCYGRIWEPHQSGYGHQHVAVFVEDADGQLAADDFRPFMNSYVGDTPGAGSEAHSVDGDAVSLNDDVENMGSYISEYLGIFGEEALERPITEQMFYATAWATNTRRLDFGAAAQEIISGEQFRRETGLRPEDRGDCETESKGDSGGSQGGDSEPGEPSEQWEVKRLCTVVSKSRDHADPETGGVRTTVIDGSSGVDPPKWVV